MNAFLDDLLLRRRRVQSALADAAADGALFASDVHLFYLTGRVFNGWLYLPTEGAPVAFVRRPADCDLPVEVVRVHRPDDMLGWFSNAPGQSSCSKPIHSRIAITCAFTTCSNPKRLEMSPLPCGACV